MDPSSEIEVEADRHTSAVDLEEKQSQPVPLGQLPADLEVEGAMRLVIKGAPEPEPLPALLVDPDEFTNGLIDVVRGGPDDLDLPAKSLAQLLLLPLEVISHLLTDVAAKLLPRIRQHGVRTRAPLVAVDVDPLLAEQSGQSSKDGRPLVHIDDLEDVPLFGVQSQVPRQRFQDRFLVTPRHDDIEVVGYAAADESQPCGDPQARDSDRPLKHRSDADRPSVLREYEAVELPILPEMPPPRSQPFKRLEDGHIGAAEQKIPGVLERIEPGIRADHSDL